MKKKFALVNSKSVFKLSLIAALIFAADLALAAKGNGKKAVGGHYTVYRYDVAAKGSCLPEHGSNPSEILRRNGIKYLGNPSRDEVAALAKGVAQVENLLGDPLPRPWRQNFNFIDASGSWNQGPTTINVRRPKGSPKGTNVGRLMHELGHRVGNSGIYQKYAGYTGRTRCAITGYAASKFNEEFAEVFEAYVVYPDLLEKKCPKAFDFMANQLFPNTHHKIAACDRTTVAKDPDFPNGIPIPIPRPKDFDTPSEVESQQDVVVTPDTGDDEVDVDDEHEETDSEGDAETEDSVSNERVPIPTARPATGVR
ncbi:hypothetical protein [Bdellovibrio reynosensis]|uniref:Uncharacterized protein n=1 Tax=Bdellovibrio reynosensis TaxID=2835041 RepID=A0ABY4CEA8_9BACT|nr:hypothetical protein [Bdellovibrio reynosensis]UOF02096.1 hypothetical protein MNR06_03895 [Bdellovibrio reynosensis]